MAHALHLRVTAEGLETGWQVSQLRRIGCRAGQGYYFSKPLPAAELRHFLKAKRRRGSEIARLA